MSHPHSAATPAMILAAGRGMRMRPLTDVTPKPLLEVRGRPLMQWSMDALWQGGFGQMVVNTAWLGEQIEARFADWPDAHAGARLSYSHEGQDFGYALETAGGISRALPLLGEVFWVLAGDVYAPGFAFTPASVDRFVAGDMLAHLWLVPNPAHNPRGDFGIGPQGQALNRADEMFTYSTIGLYRRALFEAPWCDTVPGQSAGHGGATGTVAARSNGRRARECRAVPRRLDRRRNTRAPCRAADDRRLRRGAALKDNKKGPDGPFLLVLCNTPAV